MENFVFTHAGREWNEDQGYVCEDFGFVIDGATGLTDEKYSDMTTDAMWFANWWCNELKTELSDKSKSIRQILEDGTIKVKKEYKKLAGKAKVQDFPSATISIARVVGDILEIYTLGDSPIVMKSNTGRVEVVRDTRNSINDFATQSIIKDLAIKENRNVCESFKLHKEYVLEGRLKRNNYGSYYILADDPEAIKYGFYQVFHKDLVKKVLLMTDGYSQTFDLIKFINEEELMKKLNSPQDAEKIFNKLNSLQNKDKYGDKYIRFKTSDDATVVCMNF